MCSISRCPSSSAATCCWLLGAVAIGVAVVVGRGAVAAIAGVNNIVILWINYINIFI